MITFITTFGFAFLLLHSFYGVKHYFKSLYISFRLTLNNKNDYFFKLITDNLFKRNVMVSCKVDSDGYLITIADDSGITYFIDVNIVEDKFKMNMRSMFLNCFIFDEDLNSEDVEKLNKLVELSIIKSNSRTFINDFEIEIYKNK